MSTVALAGTGRLVRGHRLLARDAARRRRPAVPKVAGDALHLPFADATFDAVTISFGLRNVEDPDAALRRARPGDPPRRPAAGLRVLGRRPAPIRWGYPTWYLAHVLPAVARRVSSNPEAYLYLEETIDAWPDQPALAQRIAGRGLDGRGLAQHDGRRRRAAPRRTRPDRSRRLTGHGPDPGGGRATVGGAAYTRARLRESVHKVPAKDPESPALESHKESPVVADPDHRPDSGPTPTSSSSVPARPARPPPPISPAPGVDVLLLEKSTFPRDKVCGDGLTPRGVKQVLALGVDVLRGADWIKNRACGSSAAASASSCRGRCCRTSPTSALVRPRRDFDEMLAATAGQGRRPDARGTTVTDAGRATSGPAGSPASTAKTAGTDRDRHFRAPLIAGLRRGVGPGRARHGHQQARRPAARRRRPPLLQEPGRTNDDYLESHLELWDRSDPAQAEAAARLRLDLRAGRRHRRTSGSACCNSSKAFGKTDYRALLRTWLDGTPEEWGLREENADRLDRRRRPADGLQPHPALRRRAAAGRRRGRRGQPVQRRGHRLRDGVGGASPPSPSLQALGRPDGPSRGGGAARLRDGA